MIGQKSRWLRRRPTDFRELYPSVFLPNDLLDHSHAKIAVRMAGRLNAVLRVGQELANAVILERIDIQRSGGMWVDAKAQAIRQGFRVIRFRGHDLLGFMVVADTNGMEYVLAIILTRS
jgi:hypothetical protein